MNTTAPSPFPSLHSAKVAEKASRLARADKVETVSNPLAEQNHAVAHHEGAILSLANELSIRNITADNLQ